MNRDDLYAAQRFRSRFLGPSLVRTTRAGAPLPVPAPDRSALARRPRTRPYTVRGVRRVPCFRCGRPSWATWQICALGRRFLGLCPTCDVLLNLLVLRWAGVPSAEFRRVATRYARTVTRKLTREGRLAELDAWVREAPR